MGGRRLLRVLDRLAAQIQYGSAVGISARGAHTLDDQLWFTT